MSFSTMIYTLSEGNPGAISVIATLMKDTDYLRYFDILLRHNITGSKLWIGYKYSDKSIDTLLKNLDPLNREMVKHINASVTAGYCGDNATIVIMP